MFFYKNNRKISTSHIDRITYFSRNVSRSGTASIHSIACTIFVLPKQNFEWVLYFLVLDLFRYFQFKLMLIVNRSYESDATSYTSVYEHCLPPGI